jgi:hypothetical protein
VESEEAGYVQIVLTKDRWWQPYYLMLTGQPAAQGKQAPCDKSMPPVEPRLNRPAQAVMMA